MKLFNLELLIGRKPTAGNLQYLEMFKKIKLVLTQTIFLEDIFKQIHQELKQYHTNL